MSHHCCCDTSRACHCDRIIHLDPDNPDDERRLRELLNKHRSLVNDNWTIARRVLEDLRPVPPTPEPRGRWAVVQDARGDRWRRKDPSDNKAAATNPWVSLGPGVRHTQWQLIKQPVTVVFPGVE